MTEIDWEAAKSGKRLLRWLENGQQVRYVGALSCDRHAVAFRYASGDEFVHTYNADGSMVGDGGRLTQDPEVIEFKRWVNVYPENSDQVSTLWGERNNAEKVQFNSSPLAVAVPITIRITGDKVEIFGGTE